MGLHAISALIVMATAGGANGGSMAPPILGSELVY